MAALTNLGAIIAEMLVNVGLCSNGAGWANTWVASRRNVPNDRTVAVFIPACG